MTKIEQLVQPFVGTFTASAHTPEELVENALHVLQKRAERAETELRDLKTLLADPAAVYSNILRGTIARPEALDRYDELQQKFTLVKLCNLTFGEVITRARSGEPIEEAIADITKELAASLTTQTRNQKPVTP